MSNQLRLAALVCVALVTTSTAQASRHQITGQVLDRNAEPVDRAIVSLSPGNVQMVTDREGRFLIDYLRDEDGRRIRLGKKREYTLEVFKPGYHIEQRMFFYKRGSLQMDNIAMKPETIRVEDMGEDLDPELYTDETHSGGATYEGQ